MTLLNFWIKLTRKGISELKKMKNYIELYNFDFWNKFAKKVYFRLKTQKNDYPY